MFRTLLAASAVCSSLLAGAALAQDFPTKPVRILTSEAGSGSDVIGRIVADALATRLGQRVLIENRGIVAPNVVMQAAPDGYTMLAYSTPLWTSPMLSSETSWDVLRDFIPVTMATNTPNVLVVNPNLQAKSVKELIALAKSQPGKLNYGSGSTGSGAHLTGELFNAMAGVNIVRVPYKGSGPAVVATVSGEVQMVFGAGASVVALIKAGKLRALAVTSPKPSVFFPDLPTMAETLPGFESGAPLCLFVPAKTPAPIVQKLYRSITDTVNAEDVKKRVMDAGAEVVALNPEEFTGFVKAEITRWGKLIRERGIHE